MTTYKYSGHWKTTGFTIGNTKWHSGRIAIACDVSGFWHCNLKINADKAVTKDVLVSTLREASKTTNVVSFKIKSFIDLAVLYHPTCKSGHIVWNYCIIKI